MACALLIGGAARALQHVSSRQTSRLLAPPPPPPTPQKRARGARLPVAIAAHHGVVSTAGGRDLWKVDDTIGGPSSAELLQQPAPATCRSHKVQASKRTILVAVDDSPAAEEACWWTIDNLLQPDDTMYLVHVAEVPPSTLRVPADMFVVFPDQGLTPKEMVEQSASYIKTGLAHRVEVLAPDVHMQVEVIPTLQTGAGAVGHLLCQRAAELRAVAIVLASHEEGPMHRLFLGSTADYCARHGTVPVIITHGNGQAPQA